MMSKLDELLKEWDAGVKQYGSRNLATVAADMADELRRLQARDRRLDDFEVELVNRAVLLDNECEHDRATEVRLCYGRFRAIREET